MRERARGEGRGATVAKKKRKAPAKQKHNVAAKTGSTQSDAHRILAAVKRIPRGHVSTYGGVAEVAGLPRRARLVGTVLRQTSVKVPWFRVINAGGRISFAVDSDAYERQRSHLEAEGIELIRGKVDLRRYGWPAHEAAALDELLWKV